MELKELIDLSNKAFQERNFQKTIELLKKIIVLQPNRYEIYLRLGLASSSLGNLDDAIGYLEKGALINQNSSPIHCNLGNLYAELNNKSLALKNYFKAIELDPKNFNANYNLGNYFYKIDDLENAEKYLNLAINIIPNHIYVYNSLFLLYDRSNSFKKLEEILIKAKNFFPKNSLIKFFEGIVEYKKKNFKEAIDIFLKADLDKKDISRNMLKTNYIAKSYDQLGMFQEAFKFFEISNKMSEELSKYNSNKEKFLDLILKRIDYFSNFIENSNQKKLNNNKKSDPVFLIGFPRSGTTLLDTILRTHNSIEVLEEKPVVDRLLKEMEKKMGCSFSNLKKIEESEIKKLQILYNNERKNYLEFDEDKIYVDKFPLNIIYLAEINKIFPNAKYILALRNPRDSVLSCFMQSFKPNNAMANMLSINDASILYDKTMELFNIYQKNLDLKIHIIKYEDVINNFEPTIKNLLKFLQVEWTNNLSEFYKTAENKRIISTPSYDQVNKPLYNKSIGRWKNYEDKFIETSKIFEKWNKDFNY
jgi:tetratricopeptide (TPR) repeat protein